jgi:hypothetical protein
MKTYIKLVIDETGADCPAKSLEESHRFNQIVEYFDTVELAKEYLTNRYGKMPSDKRKIYNDDEDGNPIEVGFLTSFWNKDYSHNSKSWYQTDWITLYTINSTNLLVQISV